MDDPRDLTPEEIGELTAIARRSMPLLDAEIDAQAWKLPPPLRRELVVAVASNLEETGFQKDQDHKPNARGLLLEGLIDKINPAEDRRW